MYFVSRNATCFAFPVAVFCSQTCCLLCIPWVVCFVTHYAFPGLCVLSRCILCIPWIIFCHATHCAFPGLRVLSRYRLCIPWIVRFVTLHSVHSLDCAFCHATFCAFPGLCVLSRYTMRNPWVVCLVTQHAHRVHIVHYLGYVLCHAIHTPRTHYVFPRLCVLSRNTRIAYKLCIHWVACFVHRHAKHCALFPEIVSLPRHKLCNPRGHLLLRFTLCIPWGRALSPSTIVVHSLGTRFVTLHIVHCLGCDLPANLRGQPSLTSETVSAQVEVYGAKNGRIELQKQTNENKKKD